MPAALKDYVLEIIQADTLLRKMLSAIMSGSFSDQIKVFKEYVDTRTSNPNNALEAYNVLYGDSGYGNRRTINRRLNDCVIGMIRNALKEKKIVFNEGELTAALDEIFESLETMIKKNHSPEDN